MKSIIMMNSYSGEEGIEKHDLYFKLLDMIEEYQTIYIVVENAGHISNLDNAKFINKIFSKIFKL